jgi:hypothetical protein
MPGGYRFRRRSFLAGVGGAFGLRILLDNLEASAQGATSPPRLFVMSWPSGTIRYHFVPAVAGRDYVTTRILRPFEVAGLREDMIVLHGLSHVGIRNLGGGAEGGTVIAVTGTDTLGTRDNMGEADDPIAGGPSFDQIFLKHAADLQRPAGPGYAHAIADHRVDSYETSTRCLSYGYEKRDVLVSRPTPGTMQEAAPLLPALAPAELFAKLFSGFMPGGDTPENIERTRRGLRLRKSVLDSALVELDRVHDLAPSSEWPKLEAHADAIRKLELELDNQLANPDASCPVPMSPDPLLIAKTGDQLGGDYGRPQVEVEDGTHVEQVGKAHAAVIRAAFQCDLIRVASLNWCPGTNHVAFAGMYPLDPTAIFLHHPLTHRISSSAFYNGPPPGESTMDGSVWEFFVNAHTWFNQKTADILVDFKNATDVYGNSLLDHTIVPFITDVGEPADTNNSKPALILGGRALGMQGGTFVPVSSGSSSHNNLWMTIAQAYLKTGDPLAVLTEEVFTKTNVAPIPELWVSPG